MAGDDYTVNTASNDKVNVTNKADLVTEGKALVAVTNHTNVYKVK